MKLDWFTLLMLVFFGMLIGQCAGRDDGHEDCAKAKCAACEHVVLKKPGSDWKGWSCACLVEAPSAAVIQ